MMHEDSPLLEAIGLWEKITGVAPPDESGYFSGSHGAWLLRDTYIALKEALELDPSEVTATLLLSKFLEEYLREATTSIADLLDAPEEHLETLRQARRLRTLLAAPDVIKARDAFVLGLRAALALYGAGDREDIAKLLQDHGAVAILRRDALRSLAKLRVDQFLEGAPEAEGVKPVYVPDVHRWWNINSLLRTMTSTPSGVALNLIRDPFLYDSYFAFSVRNGSNLFVLSDVPDHAHPLQGQMARKPGRDLDKRASRNWFPYELLGVEFDDKEGLVERLYSDEKAVAVYQPDAIPMKAIKDLGPAETLWCVMMLDLIVKKFWERGFKLPQLSYTGEMIRTASVLLEQARAAGLPVSMQTALDVQELTIADVTGADVDPAQVGAVYDSPNEWLVERYKRHLPEEALNLIGAPRDRPLLLDHKTGEIRPRAKTEPVKPFFKAEIVAAQSLTNLEQLSSAKFGTAAELEADRRWVARYNLATHIDRLARQEYEAREGEVLTWYRNRVRKNLPALLTWAANGTIWVDNGSSAGRSWHHTGGWGQARETGVEGNPTDPLDWHAETRLCHTFMRTHDLTVKGDLYDRMEWYAGHNMTGAFYARRTVKTLSGIKKQKLTYAGSCCAVTGAKASYAVTFYPVCPEELAVLAGCEVSDLPDVLQHWSKIGSYRGNSILDRIDPMIWNAHNPWRRMEMRIRVLLSIRGLAAVRKAPALPPLPVISEAEARSQRPAPLRVQFGGKDA
jgi:hypothetical protein